MQQSFDGRQLPGPHAGRTCLPRPPRARGARFRPQSSSDCRSRSAVRRRVRSDARPGHLAADRRGRGERAPARGDGASGRDRDRSERLQRVLLSGARKAAGGGAARSDQAETSTGACATGRSGGQTASATNCARRWSATPRPGARSPCCARPDAQTSRPPSRSSSRRYRASWPRGFVARSCRGRCRPWHPSQCNPSGSLCSNPTTRLPTPIGPPKHGWKSWPNTTRRARVFPM